jgi:hypothetical protein
MAIVRSEGEIRVSSDLRQDLRRRLAESAAVAMAGGVVYAVLTSVGLVRPSLTFHIIVGAALPWIRQLFALPNVLGARPLPSHTVRITDAHVTLEKYGVEYGRLSRPVILRRGRWWSPLVGDVLRGADGRLWLRPRALGAAELRTLEALLGDADPRVGTSAGT